MVPDWALNAQQLGSLAFKRQGQLPPGCAIFLSVFHSVFAFFIVFVTSYDHQPTKKDKITKENI
ncbi:hypothetical protein DRJ72_14245 [Enterococcus faecalis]|nr:hypothetical protein DRJ72_14245 [Enterococcus faecalis]